MALRSPASVAVMRRRHRKRGGVNGGRSENQWRKKISQKISAKGVKYAA